MVQTNTNKYITHICGQCGAVQIMIRSPFPHHHCMCVRRMCVCLAFTLFSARVCVCVIFDIFMRASKIKSFSKLMCQKRLDTGSGRTIEPEGRGKGVERGCTQGLCACSCVCVCHT